MAEIYSPIPASSQIFTSKSRPPLGQSMSVLSRHNQLSSNAAAALPQLAKVTQKRRHSDDSDDDMEPRNQSPTPEKPRVLAPARSRKLAMKKVRVEPEGSSQGKSDEQKSSEDGVDLADARILLANLPLSSYPAMIQALLEKDPSITKLLISVIPRPSADAACEAIRAATKKLRDSVPYSAAPPAASSTMRAQYTGSGGRASPLNDANNAAASTSSSTGTSTLGLNVGNFGFGSLSLNSSAIGLDFGFGSPSSSLPSTPPINAGQSHQRDAYVLSRLRPAIQEFISTVHAYLPYYSLLPAPVTLSTLQNKAPTSTKADEEKPHPNETFMVLASLTNSIISLPPKVVTALNENSSLPERLMKEWEAWLRYLDDSVNLKGEMFSGDQARSWINALDAFAVGVASSSSSGFGFGGNTGFGSFGAASMGFGGSTTGLSGWRAPSSSASLGGWGALASTPNPPIASDTSHNLPEIKKFRDEWTNRVGWLVGRQPPVGGFEAMDEL